MQKEMGEKRAFLPDFIQFLTRFADVYLAEGYGDRMGYSFSDYRQGNPHVFQVERKETFTKEYVMILRAPSEEEICWMPAGSCLISMLHFPTRPQRVALLKKQKIYAISLDGIVDDNNIRLVENMRAVAWNGLEVAFDILEKHWNGLKKESDEPIQVLILGAGMVGKHAVEAVTKLGSIERNNSHMENNGNGSVAYCVGRNIVTNPAQMEKLISRSDILVDATQRRDPGMPVIPNGWIAWLPSHAVIVDLSVDPYLLTTNPQTVRGIEGIPQGNLDKYMFTPDDPDWDLTVPSTIPSENRRTTVTCYSWPGIHPEACMNHYGHQMQPLMEALFAKGIKQVSLNGGYFERALARAKLPD
jgi:alanine dehydrogenase